MILEVVPLHRLIDQLEPLAELSSQGLLRIRKRYVEDKLEGLHIYLRPRPLLSFLFAI
jgi:hypothetical protein